MRADLSSGAPMALAAGTTACASIDAVAAEKFKALTRETAVKAAQKASLKRSRDNADNPGSFSELPAPPARRQVGIVAAFSRVVAVCVEMIWNSVRLRASLFYHV